MPPAYDHGQLELDVERLRVGGDRNVVAVRAQAAGVALVVDRNLARPGGISRPSFG